jgi:hypothetical protein
MPVISLSGPNWLSIAGYAGTTGDVGLRRVPLAPPRVSLVKSVRRRRDLV